eukprot:1249712-Prymnesium_polylepis.1
MADFATAHELKVAGCVRALNTEEAVAIFLHTKTGSKALAKAVSHMCFEIVCVPQIQNYLEVRFNGVRSVEKLEHSKLPRARLRRVIGIGYRALLLPVIAIYPPLADYHQSLVFSPMLRYQLYETMSILYFFLVSLSDLNLYRDEPVGIRDWGLLAWTAMMIFSQCQFLAAAGVNNFMADSANIVDLVAN